MPLLSRTIPRPLSGNSCRAAGNLTANDFPPSSATLEFRTLPQTRLDTICNPSPTTYQTMFRWLCRLGGNPETYTLPVMVAKRAEITAEIAALETLVLDPPPDLPAAEWATKSETLCRLRGLALALDETMKRASSSRSAPRSTQVPPVSPPLLPEAEISDPFQTE